MISWNQKEVLFKGISYYIYRYNIKSVLDIGAGDGTLADKISHIVNKYLAVERDNKKVSILKTSGLNVVKGEFPSVKISKKYDLVLSSHSIPENTKTLEKFIRTAWQLVKPAGILLIVTFKGGKGDEFKLIRELEGKSVELNELIFKRTMCILQELGKPKIKKRISNIETTSLQEMLEVVLFSLAAEGKSTRYKKEVEDLLKRDFKQSNKYSLSYEHLFIAMQKNHPHAALK
ncbi:MAG: methyltransferase domain-containing protein [Candidatus Taylorbacteria bacterium]|nr:methyltransferase domain-containing protein [Candidatus Taylorbacteria bacterium]